MPETKLNEPNDIWTVINGTNQFNFCSTIVNLWDQVTDKGTLATVWEFLMELEVVLPKELPDLVGERGFYFERDIADYIRSSPKEYFDENKRLVLLALQVAGNKINTDRMLVS